MKAEEAEQDKACGTREDKEMTLQEKVRSTMEKAVDYCEVAGVNLLVEQNGQELFYCQAGMADREGNRSMSRDTIFRLYSQSKPITAAAAMILMERGELDLCQPVSDFLPAFAEQYYVVEENCIGDAAAGGKVGKEAAPKTGTGIKEAMGSDRKPVLQPMRVWDLLRMTSGLVYPDDVTESGRQAAAVFEEMDRRLHTQEAMTTREMADALGKCTLAFEPGSSWRYGTSADVLGALIEVVTGMRFGDFLEKELFGPLSMRDTAFWVPKEKQNRLAVTYETVRSEEGNSLIRYEGDNLAVCNSMDSRPAFESGGAGLASTLDDYMRFAKMLMQGGMLDGVRILQPATVRYMMGGELLEHQQKAFEKWIGLEGFSYSNLMRICKNPAQAGFLARRGEYGWDGWLGVYFANFPEERLTLLMGTQKKDGGTFTLTRKLRNLVLGEVV